MGGLTGFLIILAAIAFFAVLNALARRRVRRMTDDQLASQWIVNPATGERVPAPPGHHHGHQGGPGGHGGTGHHGGGGSSGGGHGGGGFSGGDGGGGHHG
jgi:uncharacterized membrane protein YgcG